MTVAGRPPAVPPPDMLIRADEGLLDAVKRDVSIPGEDDEIAIEQRLVSLDERGDLIAVAGGKSIVKPCLHLRHVHDLTSVHHGYNALTSGMLQVSSLS